MTYKKIPFSFSDPSPKIKECSYRYLFYHKDRFQPIITVPTIGKLQQSFSFIKIYTDRLSSLPNFTNKHAQVLSFISGFFFLTKNNTRIPIPTSLNSRQIYTYQQKEQKKVYPVLVEQPFTRLITGLSDKRRRCINTLRVPVTYIYSIVAYCTSGSCVKITDKVKIK